ncbi:molybdopterin-dependent oxidoreductase [Alkalinema sp. FACHB-956]|uniref:molybdopterin-dependent oxidoreductase n=1 Tax=Alkalinema sp. FACHB-956 TaxID=2692768 RepID=UPI00168661C1|nr:molybdopterin-dependent oxidoreductase [Alkalinema sp. FACHB-956]
MQRRQFLQQLLQTSGGLIGASLLTGCQSQSIDPLFLMDLLDPKMPLPDHLITPIGEFYVQSYALPSQVKLENWELKIDGAVKQPLTLKFDDILNAPQEEFYLTMECIGNPAGGNLIGNARWTGTPLLPFLEKAGVQPEAVEFKMRGNDWYETTLPVAELLRPEVRLVHRMNGEPLTKEHGFPLRIIIPGHFGQKQPKWLVGIKAIAKPETGYWENQGWSNTAEIPTHALLRQVQEQRVWNGHHSVTFKDELTNLTNHWRDGILLAGVALDRSTPITQVQVSVDNGQTWQVAEHNQPSSPHEWTLWRYRWLPDRPGKYTVLARAQSGREMQEITRSDKKQGRPGILKIDVTLA